MKYKPRRYILYYLLEVLAFLCFILPLKLMRAISVGAGRLSYLILRDHRRRVIENLKLAFGDEKSEEEIKSIAMKVFENLAQTLVEFLSFSKIDKKVMDNLVKAEGLEKLDEVLKKGKGGIILAGHFGNWELLGAYLIMNGYPGRAVVKRIKFEGYNRLLMRLRENVGVKAIYRNGSIRDLLGTLRRNEFVGILPDQDVDSIDGVFVDFFGRSAYTPVAPVNIALSTGCAIIPCFMIRENGRHRLVIEDPIDLEVTGDKRHDAEVNTAKWSKVVESYIRRYPEQWVWVHRRWKTRPKQERLQDGPMTETVAIEN
ncbi:MAG: lysophospholipid acyltransferase family protein [Candidatus Omnitrophica bacterium]|nr:lysophospholipid acyltransferase family protein [Candidatus Omnitrophota bacterium]